MWPPEEDSYMSSNTKGEDKNAGGSPWTYENEGLNPALRPSNATLRRRRLPPGVSAVPPYHPDYKEPQDGEQSYSEEDTESSVEDDELAPPSGHIHVRRGSEGVEVREMGREDMLQKYLEELGEEPGRYFRYIPEPESESEEEDDDSVPLVYQTASARANGHIGNGVASVAEF